MVSSVFKQAAEMLRRRKKNKWWLTAFLCLAVVAVVGTIAVLKPTGRAMTRGEKVLVCQHAVHQHAESCWAEGENGKELVCGYADFVIHKHAESCYDGEGNLACPLPEVEAHVHEPGCYEEERVLICGVLDGEGGHVHEAGCYGEPERTLICGQEEGEAHAHSEECYQTGEAPLICGMEAGAGGHEHTEACFQVNQRLICEKPEARPHIHDESCYEKDENQNEIRVCGLLQVEEHVHRDDCFQAVEEESTDAAVTEAESVSETETAAETESAAETETAEAESADAAEKPVYVCGKEEHAHDEACRDENGELTCGLEEHVHDESCLAEEEQEYVCGLEEHAHGEECYDENGGLICGLEEHVHGEGCLAAPEMITQTWGSEKYVITAAYTAAAGLPENALLQVEEITAQSDPERYAQREAEAKELLEEALSVRGLFKIGFYVDGEEVEPQDKVTVTIQFLDEDGYAEGEPIRIIHFAEEATELLEATEINGEGATSFDAKSFSEYMAAGVPDPEHVKSAEELKSLAEAHTGDAEPLTLTLENDIVFTGYEGRNPPTDATDLPVAITPQQNAKIVLDLNGHTITVDCDWSLFNVTDTSSLVIKDSTWDPANDVRDSGKAWNEYGWKKDGGSYANGTLTYYEIDSSPSGAGTAETLYTHTVQAGGKIISGTNLKGQNALISVKNGTLTLESGMLNGDGKTRAVLLNDGAEFNELNLSGGYICSCASGVVENSWSAGKHHMYGGAVLAYENTTINLTGTVLAGNHTLYSGTTEGYGSGGAIAMLGRGTFNMSGGMITGNESSTYGKGGGLYTWDGVTVNLSGGNICNNNDPYREPTVAWVSYTQYDKTKHGYKDRIDEYAQHDGGGGILIGSGCTLNMRGGKIVGNTGAAGGGIQTTTKGATSLYISGGTVARNLAEKHEGGGIVTVGERGYAQIITDIAGPVYITNNKTATELDWGGGAMFCGEKAHLIVQNALVTDNVAEGFGGGIGGCSNAAIYNNTSPVSLSRGTAVYGNTANGTNATPNGVLVSTGNSQIYSGSYSGRGQDRRFAMNDGTFLTHGYADYYCEQYSTVSNLMLGGGFSNWEGSYNDSANDEAADSIGQTKAYVFEKDKDDALSSRSRMGLTAYPSADSKAKAQASVFISGNYSNMHGGGIQCNGFLVMGEYKNIDLFVDLQLAATKQLFGADGTQSALKGDDYSFGLYRYVNGTETLCGTAQNDASGAISFENQRFTGSLAEGDSEVQFLVRELEDGLPGNVLRDSAEYLVTVTVTGSKQENVADNGTTYHIQKYAIKKVEVQSRPGSGKAWSARQPLTADTDPSGSRVYSLPAGDAGASFTNNGIVRKNIAVEKTWTEGTATNAAKAKVASVTVELLRREAGSEDWTVHDTQELKESNGWRHEWQNLVVQGTETGGKVWEYRVRETKVTFTDNTSETFADDGTSKSFKGIISSSDTQSGTETYTITNTHVDDLRYSLRLFKTGQDENKKPTNDGNGLSGAEFALRLQGGSQDLNFIGSDGVYVYAEDPEYEKPEYADKKTTTLVTDSSGYILINNLPVGTYQFTETKAPVGYSPNKNIEPIEIKASTMTEEVDQGSGGKIKVATISVVDDLYYYQIPESGGAGTARHTAAGVTLLLLALGIACFRLRKKGGERNI